MAYTDNTFALISPGAGKYDTRCFTYRTMDDLATVTGAAYIEDAKDRGARKGDIVDVVKVDDLTDPTPGSIEHSRFVIDDIDASTGAGTIVAAPAMT